MPPAVSSRWPVCASWSTPATARAGSTARRSSSRSARIPRARATSTPTAPSPTTSRTRKTRPPCSRSWTRSRNRRPISASSLTPTFDRAGAVLSDGTELNRNRIIAMMAAIFAARASRHHHRHRLRHLYRPRGLHPEARRRAPPLQARLPQRHQRVHAPQPRGPRQPAGHGDLRPRRTEGELFSGRRRVSRHPPAHRAGPRAKKRATRSNPSSPTWPSPARARNSA